MALIMSQHLDEYSPCLCFQENLLGDLDIEVQNSCLVLGQNLPFLGSGVSVHHHLVIHS